MMADGSYGEYETKDEEDVGTAASGAAARARATLRLEKASTGVNPLMASLAVPRKSFKRYGIKGTTAITAVDGRSLSFDKLPLLRMNDSEEIVRAGAAEADEVRALANVVAQTGISSSRLEGVHRMQERRKARHDEAIKSLEDFQRRLYASCEDRVLHAGRDLRSALQSVESRLEQAFRVANDAGVAAESGFDWLQAQFDAIGSLEAERRQRVDVFSAALEAVERDRASAVGARLQALTSVLIEVGYELTPPIQRIVDEYSTELNLVILANKASHVEVMAQLHSSVVVNRSRTEERWGATQAQWRLLRHTRSLQTFTAHLSSPAVVNPPSRASALADIGAAQSHRNSSTRLAIIQELAGLRPPALTPDAVEAIRKRLEVVDHEDSADVSARYQAMVAVQEAVNAEVAGELEGVRAELHRYEALHPSGNLGGVARDLAAALNNGEDAATVEWAKTAFALKSELEGVCTVAAAPNVIYSEPLNSLQNRVVLICQCLNVAPALESVGKGAERRALLGAVDSLKSAKRSEMTVTLVRIHTLCSSMSRVPTLPALVCEELRSILSTLDETIEEVHDAMVEANLEVPLPILKFLFPDTYGGGGSSSSVGSGSGGSDHDGHSSSGGKGSVRSKATHSRRGPGATTPGSVSAGRNAKSGVGARCKSRQDAASIGTGRGGALAAGASESESHVSDKRSVVSKRTGRKSGARSQKGSASVMSGMTDEASHVLGAILPLSTIRSLQKRVLVVASASDIPLPVQAVLTRLLSACAVQAVANEGVDQAISSQCAQLLERRWSESTALLKRISGALEVQNRSIRGASERLCSFFAEVARALSAHAEEEASADEWCTSELLAALDAFHDEDARLEAAFNTARTALVQSPDLSALDVRFADAMAALDAIEAHYRSYHAIAVKWSRLQPQRINMVLRRHRGALCKIFAMRFPQGPVVDGEPIPGEEGAAQVHWDIDGPVVIEAFNGPPSGTHEASSTLSPPTSPTPGVSPGGAKTGARPSSGSKGSRRPSLAERARAPSALSVPPLTTTPATAGAGEADATASSGGGGVGSGRKTRASVRIKESPTAHLAAATEADNIAPPGTTLKELMDSLMETAGERVGVFRTRVGTLPLQLQEGSPTISTGASTVPAVSGGTATECEYDVLAQPELIAAFLSDAEGTVQRASAERKLPAMQERLVQISGEIPRAIKARDDAKAAAEVKAAAVAAKAKTAKKGGKEDPEAKVAEELQAAYQAASAAVSALQAEQGAAEAMIVQCKAVLSGAVSTFPSPSPAELETFAHGLYTADGRPLDPAGVECVARVALSTEELAECVSALRADLLAQFEQYVVERRQLAANLTQARCDALTAELEERLRRHWPRKGELEVNNRAPRAEELVAHKERLDRFLRSYREKEAAHAAALANTLTSGSDLVAEADAHVADLSSRLPTLESLASLQGSLAASRHFHSQFTSDLGERCAEGERTAAAQTAKLAASGEEFIRHCVAFESGGKYAPSEIAAFQAEVDGVVQGSTRALEEAFVELSNLRASAAALQPHFEALFAAHETALHFLSLREGLGSKYGEPRRVAQESLRAATAWSEGSADAIDTRLAELAALLAASPGATPPSVGSPHDAMSEEVTILRASRGLHETTVVAGSGEASAAQVTATATAAGEKGKGAPGKKDATPAPSSKTAAGKPTPGGKDAASPAGITPAVDAHAATKARAAAAAAAAEEAASRLVDEGEVGARGAAPLAIRIRHVTAALRDALYARAVHLQAFKVRADMYGPLRPFHLPFVSTVGTLPLAVIPPCFSSPSDPAPLIVKLEERDGAQHSVKGVSPGAAKGEAHTRPPLMETVASALSQCKAATIALFAQEGHALSEEDGIPPSLADFMAREQKKAEDLKEYSTRRFRDQLQRLDGLLQASGEVIVGDVAARQRAASNKELAASTAALRDQLRPLEAQRLEHIAKLRLALGDPNAGSQLQSLATAEQLRMAAVRTHLQTAIAAEGARCARTRGLVMAEMAVNVALWMLLADECVMTEDLAPLPGDEQVLPPKKASFRKLHKSMRKSGTDVGAALAAAALGDTSLLHLDEGGECVIGASSATASDAGAPMSGKAPPASPAAAASGAKGVAPKAAAGGAVTGTGADKGKVPAGSTASAKGAKGVEVVPVPSPSPALPIEKALKDVLTRRRWDGVSPDTTTTPLVSSTSGTDASASSLALAHTPVHAAVVGAVESAYLAWARHAVRARDEGVSAVLRELNEGSEKAVSKLETAVEDVSSWEGIWVRQVSSLMGSAVPAVASPLTSTHTPASAAATALAAAVTASSKSGTVGKGEGGASKRK